VSIATAPRQIKPETQAVYAGTTEQDAVGGRVTLVDVMVSVMKTTTTERCVKSVVQPDGVLDDAIPASWRDNRPISRLAARHDVVVARRISGQQTPRD